MKEMTIILLAMLLTCSGCSTIEVYTDQAEDADLSSYSSFGFYELKDEDTDAVYFSQINQERFVDAITSELSTLGYKRTDSPDLKIAFFLKVTDKRRVVNDHKYYGGPSYWGHYHGYGLEFRMSQVIDYKLGSFILDMVDVEANRLVWQGVIEGEFFENEAITKKDIDGAIAKLFKKFPR
jgi:hypothetical protein